VIKIEKIWNPSIFDRFSGELRRTLKKYPYKRLCDIMKLLFHGTSKTDPKIICGDEYGLDNRFSRPGMYGNGIYFANNSNYSITYAF
jgi:poly [ADP-ribose] polymerase 10/14/15